MPNTVVPSPQEPRLPVAIGKYIKYRDKPRNPKQPHKTINETEGYGAMTMPSFAVSVVSLTSS